MTYQPSQLVNCDDWQKSELFCYFLDRVNHTEKRWANCKLEGKFRLRLDQLVEQIVNIDSITDKKQLFFKKKNIFNFMETFNSEATVVIFPTGDHWE